MPPEQSYFDNLPEEQLRGFSAQYRNDTIGHQARLALSKRAELKESKANEERHREVIEESRASRQLNKRSFVVAGISLVLSAASTGIAVVALMQSTDKAAQEPESSASPSLVKEDHEAQGSAAAPTLSAPATTATQAPPIPKPNKKPTISPPPPKE